MLESYCLVEARPSRRGCLIEMSRPGPRDGCRQIYLTNSSNEQTKTIGAADTSHVFQTMTVNYRKGEFGGKSYRGTSA